MESTHILLKQIEYDKQNIQTMMDMLPLAESKGEYRSIAAAMKVLKREIHYTRLLIENKTWFAEKTVRLPLFEVEPSPVDYMQEFEDMDSFFGELK